MGQPDVLEGASFQPRRPLVHEQRGDPAHEPQLLGRPFAAVVLPGCDEVRLQPLPEPPGDWTAAQREAWGLPIARVDLQAIAQRAAWQHALRTPLVDVLWRTSDDRR